MPYRNFTLSLITWLISSPLWADSLPVESLSLEKALPIEEISGRLQDLEPSGLAVCNNQLLMVSDNHNEAIFSVDSSSEVAVIRSHINIEDIPKPDLDSYSFGTRWWSRLSHQYDWEGISCDSQGRYYVLSEALAQVLVKDTNGSLRWLGSQSYTAGRSKGLFEQHNAFAEGLAVNGNTLVMAAERQPRGMVLMETNNPTHEPPVTVLGAHHMSGFPSLLRPKDFSGLWLEGNSLYTLERNHFQICRRNLSLLKAALIKTPRDEKTSSKSILKPDHCWSYAQVEQNPKYAYQDQRFGKAEGLARWGQHLYLVLDNNGNARQINTEDQRPQLFVFKVPDNW